MTGRKENNLGSTKLQQMGLIAGGVVACGLGALALRYKVAGPSQYVIRTGMGIKDISITKKAFVWPFQKHSIMDISPSTFPIEVEAMSFQRIPFKMPSVWTIGPKNDNSEALTSYARLLAEKGHGGLQTTVEGVIQGETRVLTANIDLNDLFSNRDTFKEKVVNRINEIIDDFGLKVYNANIAELRDLDEHNKYFEEQKKRALQKVNQEARVAMAEAYKDGEIGESEQRTESRQKVAGFEKDAVLVEYQRNQEIAQSLKDLEVAKAQYKRETEVAQIEAQAISDQRKWELQQEVERKRQLQQTESLRASDYTKADVDAEIAIRKSQGIAEAVKIKAEADLYAKQQEANGIKAIRGAEAEGLRMLVNSVGGDIDNLNRYIMVRDNILPELAEKQASALKGLNPRINVWNTGNQENGNLSGVITDVFKTSMPLFDGIKGQTGYDFLKSMGVENGHQQPVVAKDVTVVSPSETQNEKESDTDTLVETPK